VEKYFILFYFKKKKKVVITNLGTINYKIYSRTLATTFSLVLILTSCLISIISISSSDFDKTLTDSF
jgi:uncharacterized Tic20 family protein